MSDTEPGLGHCADRVPSPDGARTLMAARIVSRSVEQVTWTVAQLIQDDQIHLTTTLPLLHVHSVRPHRLPMLRTVTVDVLHGRLTEPADTRTVSLGRVELVLPEDMPCTMLYALRGASHRCVRCERWCVHLYDAAQTAPPDTVLCEECDQQVTEDVLATLDPERATPTPDPSRDDVAGGLG